MTESRASSPPSHPPTDDLTAESVTLQNGQIYRVSGRWALIIQPAGGEWRVRSEGVKSDRQDSRLQREEGGGAGVRIGEEKVQRERVHMVCQGWFHNEEE